MDHSTLTKALGAAGILAIALGRAAAMVGWKSRRLPTASIQRRVYWIGSIVSAVLLFLSQWPDWRSGLIIAVAVAFFMVAAAWRFTSHLKVGGRIYAASPYHRKPDAPPALAEADD
jgi:hypothetical protein